MNSKGLSQRFALIICLAGTLSGTMGFAQQQSSQKYESIATVLARVPQKARGKSNPFQTDPTAAIAGRKLFGQYCAECHGRTAEGSTRAPSLQSAPRETQPGEMFWIITNGVVRHGMPSWSKLPDAQRWQIVAFLFSINPPRGPN